MSHALFDISDWVVRVWVKDAEKSTGKTSMANERRSAARFGDLRAVLASAHTWSAIDSDDRP